MLSRIKGMVVGRSAVLAAVWSHPLNRGSKLRAVGDYLLWNAVKFTFEGRHVLKLTDDLEIILGRQENYGSAVYAHNLADYHEMMFLAHSLRPGDIFLDVGANVGMYSVWVAGVSDARAIAFEPVPGTYSTLLKNIRLNALDSRITAHQVAVGEEAGSVTMTVGEGGLNHIVKPAGRERGTVEVQVERLDRICTGCEPTAMKLDVEGFELQALRGATGLLDNRSLKAIVIELQDWTLNRFGTSEHEVRDFLASFGFEPHRYNPETRILAAANGEAGLNEIFVRDAAELQARLKASPPVRIPMRPAGI